MMTHIRKSLPQRSCGACASTSSNIRPVRKPNWPCWASVCGEVEKKSEIEISGFLLGKWLRQVCRLEQFDFALGDFFWRQLAVPDKGFVAINPISAVALGVIKRFIGPVDDVGRRIV